MAVKENEDTILERLLHSSGKQRRVENARDEKELNKAQKRRQELNNLFDEGDWYAMVDFMKVYGKEDVRFTFKNGMEVPVKTE